MKNLIRLAVLALVFGVLAPARAQATVIISEIMYDLPGADEGREWIEIYNDGDSGVDLADWKFVENGSNHGLTATGSTSITAGGYAIIVADPAQFASDWPSVSGLIFDSSFSLANTGEELALKDSAGEIIDSATYDVNIGGVGDGNSLQLSSGDWLTARPTPGESNSDTIEEPEVPADGNPDDSSDGGINESSNTSSGSRPSNNSTRTVIPINPSLKIEVAKAVLTKIETAFYTKAAGVEGIKNVEWSFGDGTTAHGQRISHTYLLPGNYTVLVTARAKGVSEDLSARLTLTVAEPKVVIETVTIEAVTLVNKSTSEVNLLNWKLVGGGREFVFPLTIVAASGKLSLAHAVTGLVYDPSLTPALYLPSGVEVARFTATMPVVATVPVALVKKVVPVVAPVVATPVVPTATTSQFASVMATATSVFVVKPPIGWWGNAMSWIKNIW